MVEASYVCPYCFSKHFAYELEFRCIKLQCGICFPVTAESSFYIPEHGVCPQCHGESRIRVCPTCHNTLPNTVDTENDVVISIVGGKGDGKSSYLGVLIREMKQRIAVAVNGEFDFFDEESKEEYKKRYEIIPSIKQEKRPILCDFTLKKRGFLNQITIPYSFVFYDSPLSNHVANSKGIIFVIDSIQISSSKGSSLTEYSTTDLLFRLVTLIRTQNRIPESKKIEIPIVVAVTKLDGVKHLLPANLWMFRESSHIKSKGYNRQEEWSIKEEVEGILYEWGQEEFLKYLEYHFSTYQLSVCSALGKMPTQTTTIAQAKPHRIEDGLLWIMKQNKMY